jgi:integrase
MKRKLPMYVHKKVSKGRTYYYFDTGQRDDKGNRLLSRLPDIRSHKWGAAYQAAKGQRTKKGPDTVVKSFDWLVQLFERSHEFRALADNSKRHYTRYLADANEEFRKHGRSAPLALVTAEQVLTLRDKFGDQPGKANAIVRSIGALYHWAKKPGRRYVKENITAEIEPLEGGEHQPWPIGLVEEALGDPAMRLPVGLLYFTGQRIGDVVKMGRDNLAQGILAITQQKTGKKLRITVHQRLAEILEADAPKGEMLFLVNEHGKPLTDSGLRQRIQKWASERGHSVVPHGLRKNSVNALLEAGCSTAEVSAITGQSLQMIEHYAKERDNEHLGRAAILKFERGTKDERANRS